MKTFITCVAVSFLLAGVVSAKTEKKKRVIKEKYYVVRISDFNKDKEYRVMTTTEFKALEKQIREEKFLASKCLTATTKEWAASDTKRAKFSRSAVSPRACMRAGKEFKSAGEASESAEELTKREEVSRKVRDKKRESQRNKARRGGGGQPQKSEAQRLRENLIKEKLKKNKEEEEELEEEMRSAYRSNMEKLIAERKAATEARNKKHRR